MTQRERSLLVVFLVIIGGGGTLWLANAWFLAPLRNYNKQAETLNAELKQKEDEHRAVQLGKKQLLEKLQPKSLPTNVDSAVNEYQHYLRNVLTRQSELTVDELKAQPPPEKKAPPPGAPPKTAGHTVLTFLVRGKGHLSEIVRALETMQKTPLLHRVKNLTLDRLDRSGKEAKEPNPRIQFTMTVEGLIVNNAHRHSNLLGPDSRLVLLDSIVGLRGGPMGLATLGWAIGPAGPVAQRKAAEDTSWRNYASLERKNVFAGQIPIAESAASLPDGPDPLPYIRLVSTTPSSNEAHLFNPLSGLKEMRLRPERGFDTFLIKDVDSDRVILKGKVLKVTLRELYFMVGEEAYVLHIGDTLAQAMSGSLSEKRLSGALSDAQLKAAGLLETFYTELRNLDANRKALGAGASTEGNSEGKKKSGKKR